MIEKLVVAFFLKVEEKEGRKKIHGKSRFLVNNLLEEKYGTENFIDIQTVTRLQKKYINNDLNVSVSAPKLFLKDVMASYLGYEDYEDFVSKNSSDIKPNDETFKAETTSQTETITYEKPESNRKKTIIISLIAILLLIPSYLIYFYIKANNNDCVIWTEDKYKKVPCSTIASINSNNLHIDINEFQKIKVDKNYPFFIKGKPNVWYGKNNKGIIEYFNFIGLHPETDKSLKPITEYILNKEGLLP